MEVLRQDSELIGIDMALDLKRLTHFRNLMPMVEVLHSLLQPDSDQQTNDDGRDVDEKVFPRMDGLVGACTSNMGGRVFRAAVCSGISRTLIAGALNSPVAAMDVSRDDEAGSPFELSFSLCLPSFIEPIIPHAGPMSK